MSQPLEPFDSLPPQQTDHLHRFNETSAKFQRYKILLRRRWWFLLLMAAVAVTFQALRITGKPVEFIALGKLVVGIRVNVDTKNNGGNMMVDTFVPQDFYGTQIEILEGGIVRSRAAARVRDAKPQLKEVPVIVTVRQNRGSSIMNVMITGEEPEYTKEFLNALLDEYMAFRQSMVAGTVNTAQNQVVTEMVAAEKNAKTAETNLTNFLKQNDVAFFEGDRNTAAGYLAQLRNNLNVLESEQRLMEKMGLDNYLKEKNQASVTGQSAAGVPAPADGPAANAPGGNVAGGAASGAPSGQTTLPPSRPNVDAGGGLSRVELDYLKSLGDLRLAEAERSQMLRTYRPEHPMVKEQDERLEKQKNLIEINRQQSMEEWERRKNSLLVKIESIKEEIKEWEVKARDANDKIVTHQALRNTAERAREDYQEWKRAFERLEGAPSRNPDYVTIMQRADTATEAEQKLLVPLTIATVIGLAAGLIILFLFDRLDDRMNSFSEFQALFPHEQIVGQVPEVVTRGDVALLKPNDDRHLYAEAFRNLRSSILFKNWKSGKPPKVILVTSAVPNEGKTTTVSNMAITLALGGSRVLLIDADLRRGGLNELFKAQVTPGFSDVLVSKLHWRDAVQDTNTKGLHLLSRGDFHDQTSELFLGHMVDEVLAEMQQEYDYVIIDSAPVLVADDTASLAPKIESVLFVVRMSSTMARLSAKALDLLYDRQVNVAGVILNRSNASLKEYTYYNYASYYSAGAKGKPA